MTITIPEKMKAIVLTGLGKHELQEIPVPKPGPFEVLSKVRAVAICGSDPEIFAGGLPGFWPPSYPFIAGHEWSGEVVAVGEGVTDLKPGDRVAGEPHKGCGFCENCKARPLYPVHELWQTRIRTPALWVHLPRGICAICSACQ